MMKRTFPTAGVAALAVLLSGCTVGPDWLRPKAPTATGYTPAPLPAQTVSAKVHSGAAQRFVEGRDIPGQWWTLFHSQALDSLITQALKANPDVDAAQYALRQAHENLLAGEGGFLPSINGNYSTAREKTSGANAGRSSSGTTFSLSTASVSVSYAPDVFGGTRRKVESLAAQAEYQRFQLEATYLTLTANVVNAAIEEGSLRARIKATRDIIADERRQLHVLQQQFELGGTSKAGVLAQQATLAQTEATLPGLQKQLVQQRNLLATLTGKYPDQHLSARFDLGGLHLPRELPVSVPSRLVEQRPDVRAAEAQLHQASAEIGVATANMLPQFTITGQLGAESGSLVNPFSAGTGIWSIAGGILQPIFHGNQLEHEKRAAVAAYHKAAAQYRSTVLGAFRNVADTLRALESDASALRAELAAEQSAKNSLDLARQQYRVGAISYVSLLDAQRTYQQTYLSLVQAQASRYADTVALFQALGGGWWNRKDTTASVENQTNQPDGSR